MGTTGATAGASKTESDVPCQFQIGFETHPEALFQHVFSEVTQAGGRVDGDATQGQALLPTPVGAVELEYTQAQQILNINVVDKPWVVGCGRIESELRALIAAADSPAPPAQPPPPIPEPPVTAPEPAPLPDYEPWTPIQQRPLPEGFWVWAAAGIVTVAGVSWWVVVGRK